MKRSIRDIEAEHKVRICFHDMVWKNEVAYISLVFILRMDAEYRTAKVKIKPNTDYFETINNYIAKRKKEK